MTDQKQGFISTLLGNQWQSATSDQVARISQVLIHENGKLIKTINADLHGPAVLQISYKQETLIVQDVTLPNSEYKNLSISSSLPFTVADGEPATDWTDSTADVPLEAPFVVFTQGGTVDTTNCGSTDVTITINVDWGKKME